MNSKFRIFIICISLAGLLWLVNHLNRDFTVGVVFNVNYEGFSFSGEDKPDSTIYAEVSGPGFSLIRFYFKRPHKFSLTKADFKSVKHGDSVFYHVLPDNLLKTVSEALPTSITLKNIPNDTLSFSFISYPSKDVPVKVKFSFVSGQNCAMNGPVKIIPRVVRITGPAEMIASIDSIETVPLILKDNCDTVRTSVKLSSFTDKEISCNISEIHVFIPIHSVKQLQAKLHYNITIHGHIYNGDVKVDFIAPSVEHEPELNLVLENDVVDNNIVFSVKCPPSYTILKIYPESIPVEQ